MELPINYAKATQPERKLVREEYVRVQEGRCCYCNRLLTEDPPKELFLDMSRFPPGFLRWPVHLHHDHNTDMTIGAVHGYCNGVLWQYHGE